MTMFLIKQMDKIVFYLIAVFRCFTGQKKNGIMETESLLSQATK
jgi:hypothetical protein